MAAAARPRLDKLLVQRGLAPSREAAQSLVMAGRVSVDGRAESKPGARIDPEAAVEVAGPPRLYVSRGGIKLAAALDAFQVDPEGRIAVDIGSSTGGFTDCLLKRGASRVYAVDVGRGQLDWTLRRDPRVVVLEGINARYLSPAGLPGLGEGASLAVIDVSFISLGLILPRVPPLLAPGRPGRPRAAILALVKPQFEVGRRRVGKGGIVRDPALRAEALASAARAASAAGCAVEGMAASALPGSEGNQEYFLHLKPGAGGLAPEEIEEHARRIAHGG